MNVATINVASSFEDVRTGVLATPGQASDSDRAKSFEVILKGAGVEGGDVAFSFDLGERPGVPSGPDDPDGEKLFDAKSDGTTFIDAEGNAILDSEYSKRVPVFKVGTGPSAQFLNSITGEPVPGLDKVATEAAPIAGLRYAPTSPVPIRSAGSYDVVYNFYTVPSSEQDSPNRAGGTAPFWRVLSRQQATITADTIYLPNTIVGSNDDPTRTYAELCYAKFEIDNISPTTQQIKVRVEEQNLDGSNANVVFERLFAHTSGDSSTRTLTLPVINRLRSFKLVASAYLDDAARTPAVAATSATTPLFIGVGEGNTSANAVDFGSATLNSRVSNLQSSEIVLATAGAKGTFSFTAQFAAVSGLGEPSGKLLLRNDLLGYGDPSTTDIQVAVGDPAGTYERVTSAVSSDVTVTVPVNLQATGSATITTDASVKLVTQGLVGNGEVTATGVPTRAGSVRATVTESGAGSPLSYLTLLGSPFTSPTSVSVTDRGFPFVVTGNAYSEPGAAGELIGISTNTPALVVGGSAALTFSGSLVTGISNVKTGSTDLDGYSVKRGNELPISVFVNMTNPNRNNRRLSNRNFLITTNLNVASIAGKTGGAALTAGVLQADQNAVSITSDGNLVIPAGIPSSSTARVVLVGIAFENTSNEFDLNDQADYSALDSRIRIVRVSIAPNRGSGGGVIR